jgi:large subunit ribosomal protein L13
MEKIIINGANTILGRLASYAAKQALLGKSIVIINCNDVLLSGNRENILTEYSEIRKKDSSNLKGPILPRVPEKIVKRTIRGMLSYKQKRGEDALDRIMCYNTIPAEYANSKTINLDKFSGLNKNTKTIKLTEVAKLI